MILKQTPCSVVMIGAGNVATNLAVAMYDAGFNILQVFSRSGESAYELAGRVGAAACVSINEINPDAGLYLIALRDDVVQFILPELKVNNGMVVHTSGTLPMAMLADTSSKYGVLYPLQSFNKFKTTDLRNVPFCIEASDELTLNFLTTLSSRLSGDVHILNSDQRQYLHVAAVFAANFSNFMYVAASDILRSREIDFAILLPLIQELFNKISSIEPWEAQTGPAVREDLKITEIHMQLLQAYPQYAEIYNLITRKIIEHKHSILTGIQQKQN